MIFQKKSKKELENINNKIEDREERWFELSAKIEVKISFRLDGVPKRCNISSNVFGSNA
jgi:hypothetical protein